MGVRAFLTSIPPEILDAVRESGGFEPREDILSRSYNWRDFSNVSLDKTWWLLNKVFIKAGPPLVYTLQGDYFPEGGLEAFDTRDAGDSYIAYVSSKKVRDISKELEVFPIQESLNALEDDEQYIDYCLSYYSDLVEFYEQCSVDGNAVFITVT
jgi:hypothetical protein